MQLKRKHMIFILFVAMKLNAAPPISQIKSAYIDVIQGQEIYANGKMQSVVRISVELKPGVSWDEQVSLFEVGTNQKLADVGWTESDTDNGFDHNIGSTTRAMNIDENNNRKNIIKYLSTTKPNTNIEICFEIETQKSKVKKKYTSCDKYGLDRGTAKIFAQRPYTYYASDFEFTQKQTAFKLQSNYDIPDVEPKKKQQDIKGEIYGLRLGMHMPRNLSFKLINQDRLIKIKSGTNRNESRIIVANSDKSVVRKYNIYEDEVKENMRYQEAYIYDIQDADPITQQKTATFKFINYNKKEGSVKEYQVEKKLFFKAGDENILDILNVTYYRDTFMYQKNRCWNDKSKDKYQCRAYKKDLSSLDTEQKEFLKNSATLTDDLFYEFQLQDNYGSEYTLLWNAYTPSGIDRIVANKNNEKK